MEENKDDYLKKKLHIKYRFIKRLETEKRQLEINNNSLQHRLRLVECQLNSLVSTRTTNDWEDLVTNDPAKQGSQRFNVSQATAGDITPRFIPFPNFSRSDIQVPFGLQQGVAGNDCQEMENSQLLNENLEYTLEISYLKARLKSSEAARAVGERKIEQLEERLRQIEEGFSRQIPGCLPPGLDKTKAPPCSVYSPSVSLGTNALNGLVKTCNYQSRVMYPERPSVPSCPDMSCSLMDCMDRILRVVLSLDEKMNHDKQ